jgi:hypothetical protein
VSLHHFLHQREIVLIFLQDAIQQSATLLRLELLILFKGAQQVPKGDEGGFEVVNEGSGKGFSPHLIDLDLAQQLGKSLPQDQGFLGIPGAEQQIPTGGLVNQGFQMSQLAGQQGEGAQNHGGQSIAHHRRQHRQQRDPQQQQEDPFSAELRVGPDPLHRQDENQVGDERKAGNDQCHLGAQAVGKAAAPKLKYAEWLLFQTRCARFDKTCLNNEPMVRKNEHPLTVKAEEFFDPRTTLVF